MSRLFFISHHKQEKEERIIMKIIAIANQKGGVGKTTTAMNLAAGLVQKKKKVLCIDFDPQGNLSDYLGYVPDNQDDICDLMINVAQQKPMRLCTAIRHNTEGIDYIPSSITLASADMFLAQIMCRENVLCNVLQAEEFEKYDFVIIDCLPSLGILLTNALAAANGVIIPVQAQKFSLDGVDHLLQAIRLVQRNLNPQLIIFGVLLTMTDNTNMCKAVKETLIERFGTQVFETTIRRGVEATESTYAQKSMTSAARSKIGEEYRNVVCELLKREG